MSECGKTAPPRLMFEIKFGATFRLPSTVASTLFKIYRLSIHTNSSDGYKVRSQHVKNLGILTLFRGLMLF
jgi:hypothetical protein